MKLDILAIGAHPDDVELGCGASLAKEVSRGKKVGIVDLSRGELGTRGTAETRTREATKASEILNIDIRENLDFKDGFFINDEAHQLKIIEIIRKYRPEIVLSNAENDRHPDHKRASDLINTACFLAGLPKIITTQEAWRPKKHFHYIQWLPLEPDFVVDVSGFMDLKMQACLAYKTQFYDPNSDEPQTPISSKNFTDSIIYRANDLGRLIGVEAGEGFTVRGYVGVNNLDSLV